MGQWGLVPWFAKAARLAYSTNNARFEEIATKASFKSSWKYGKWCIIPADSFDEPNWESGKNVWWTDPRLGPDEQDKRSVDLHGGPGAAGSAGGCLPPQRGQAD